jgi:putative transposase
MIRKFLRWLQERTRLWIQPASLPLPLAILADLPRSHSDLIAEIAMLHLQVTILKRQAKKPEITRPDRFWLVLFSHFNSLWKQSLHIVQPDTLLRWHRDLFRFLWRRKSQGTPKVSPETIALIRKLAIDNVLWGADRIRGELIKLGITLSKRTIQKYLPKDKKSYIPGQTWSTFLKNHADNMWACDFTVVYDWLFRPWYVFIVMELKTRRIVHTAVTNSPSDAWVAQQLREATPWGKGPEYLIHDHDPLFGSLFSAVAKSSGIEEVKTPCRTPQANGICERFMRSLRNDCLDHFLIRDDKHLARVVTEYTAYFNEDRPHQGIGQRIPGHFDLPISKPSGRIRSKAILGGLHHSYSRATDLK